MRYDSHLLLSKKWRKLDDPKEEEKRKKNSCNQVANGKNTKIILGMTCNQTWW